MFHLYRALSFLLWPLLQVVLWVRLQKGKEIPSRITEKRGLSSKPRPTGRLVWFHGASVGETLALLKLIHIILDKHKDVHILVTSGTKSSAALLKDKLPPRAFHQFAPLDHPLWVERFLSHWQPDVAIMTESDFWPNLLYTTHKKGIKLFLLNGRMSPKSFKNWKKFMPLAKTIFGFFDVFLLQRKIDKQFFRQLGVQDEKITITGNIKYSADPLPHNPQTLQTLRESIKDRPVWLYASCHPGEDKIAYKTHMALKKKYPHLLTIIVPRHPEKKDIFKHHLREFKLRAAFRSDTAAISEKTDIYIADSFGELGLFFSLTDIAFIGGSFVKLGCHNPIEAAQLKCAILFGPHIYNFSETCYDLLGREAAFQCEDDDDVIEYVSLLLKNSKKRQKMVENAFLFAQEKANIVHDVYTVLKPDLDDRKNENT